jgi:uncharacterized repeat protein (TIGR03803 family)
MKSALTTKLGITGKRVRGVSTALAFAIALVAVVVAIPSAQATSFTTLHNFQGGPDGELPYASLVMDTKGNLYGTTLQGGKYGLGTVFKVDKRGHETILYPFTGGTDGGWPFASLILDAKGNLYGTASTGGTWGFGAVFELLNQTTKGFWKEKVLYSFTGGSDGAAPFAGLVSDTAHNLYGTTNGEAPSYTGSVFKWDHTTGKATKLHDFSGGADGFSPYAGLLMDTDGSLYGTTHQGGDPACNSGIGCGTVFKIHPDGTAYKVLHSFSGKPDAAFPYYGFLVGDGKGNLYGTTFSGGALGAGEVFEVDETTGAVTDVYDFLGGSQGALPLAGLVIDTAGNVYGTTSVGGDKGVGAVFKLDTTTSVFTVLHSFNPSKDGGFPQDNLILDSKGNLYGTCAWGGSSGKGCGGHGCGTVFKLTP